MGTTILESKGTWMEGMDRHTYWILPLHILAQTAWYKMFGFSLAALRWLSIFWGAIILLSAYSLISKLFHDFRIALLTVGLLAVDSHFTWVASLGRMDAMCAGLGWAGCATFLCLRERSLGAAIVWSNAMVAASCLTHPCGALYLAMLSALILYYDRARVGFREIALAAIPYLAGLGAWGLYILQDPAQFRAQFTGNISGIASEFTDSSRWSGLRAPLTGFRREIGRYIGVFAWHTAPNAWVRSQIVILIAYALAILAGLSTPAIRRRSGYRALVLSGALMFVIMALFEGLKGGVYVVHTLPIAAALLAAYVAFYAWSGRRWMRWAALTSVVTIGCLQLAYGIESNLHPRGKWDYDAMLEFLGNHAAPTSQIMGGAEMAFRLGFHANLIDDPRLGYFSGKHPDFIVANEVYRGWFDRSRTRYPEIHAHIEDLLSNSYRPVFHNASYTVYRRM